MMRREVTPDLELKVVEILATPRSVSVAAEQTGLTFGQVNEIALLHGYPRVEKLREAIASLRAAARDAKTATVATPEAAAAAMTGRTLRTVPVADLNPDPDNPRADLGDVTELAESIRQTGLLQPIVARQHGNKLVIVAGHRRHAALILLGQATAEVLVSKDMRPSDVLAAMLIENGQRRDLDPIEEARAMQRLMAVNRWSAEAVAVRVGRSHSHVNTRLALLNLSADDQEKVRAGQMGVTHGAQVGRARAGTARQHDSYRFHLSTEHPLAGKARARCVRQHAKVRIVGHTACGECWEAVIRADEQRNSLAVSIDRGVCVTCEQPLEATPVDDAERVGEAS